MVCGAAGDGCEACALAVPTTITTVNAKTKEHMCFFYTTVPRAPQGFFSPAKALQEAPPDGAVPLFDKGLGRWSIPLWITVMSGGRAFARVSPLLLAGFPQLRPA